MIHKLSFILFSIFLTNLAYATPEQDEKIETCSIIANKVQQKEKIIPVFLYCIDSLKSYKDLTEEDGYLVIERKIMEKFNIKL